MACRSKANFMFIRHIIVERNSCFTSKSLESFQENVYHISIDDIYYLTVKRIRWNLAGRDSLFKNIMRRNLSER